MYITKKLNLPTNEYYKTHLMLVNAMFPVQMTDRELDVVAAFIKEGGFSTASRKRVKNALGISPSNLSNFLKSLQAKGFVVGSGRADLRIHDKILPLSNKEQVYYFTLNCVEE